MNAVSTFFLALTAAAALASPAMAAEHRDHLDCFRIEDGSAAEATVDLATLPFGVDEGCTVKAAARELCVPAPAHIVDGEMPEAALRGENLVEERVCYRIACPERELAPVTVSDRFGTRQVTVRKPRLLCVAAQ